MYATLGTGCDKALKYTDNLLLVALQVHFGRIRMKPGKPTTFASIPKKTEGGGTCYFFGLPGNPVSCLVCKTLVVDCALKRLQGVCSRGM